MLRTIVALCDGTVVCAVLPRWRRHKRRRLRRGCGAHRPNAAGRNCARDRRCGSVAALVVAAVVLSLDGVCIRAHPHAGCRPTRAMAGAVGVRIWWSFARRFRVLLGAFGSSFAQALATWLLRMHADYCSRALLVVASGHACCSVTCRWLPHLFAAAAFPARAVMHVQLDICLCIYRCASTRRTCYREGRGWLPLLSMPLPLVLAFSAGSYQGGCGHVAGCYLHCCNNRRA